MGDATSTGQDAGASAGAAYASAEFGPEAGPVGAAIGGFVGGKLGGAVGSIFGGGGAACECQLGSCDDDDNLDLAKYNVLRAQCDPAVAGLIDRAVEQQMVGVRAQLANVPGGGDIANRFEICGKLAAYAKAAAEHWTVPPNNTAAQVWRAQDAACKAQGYAAWNGSHCVAVPKVPLPCPGAGRNKAGDLLTYRDKDGNCVSCPNGVETVNQGQANMSFRCKETTLAAKVVKTTAVVAGVGALGWVAWKFVPWRALFGKVFA